VAWNDSAATTSATLVINSAANELENALSSLRTESSKLSSNLSVVTTRQDFTSSMINTLKEGADNLTLADMNEEGANMLMLQTRQNLGITSLSMASQAAQSVLKLF
jgi:flagellin